MAEPGLEQFTDSREHAGIDIKKYIFKILSYWYLFIISVAIAYFIAYWINKYAIPTYSMNSTVMIKKESSEEEFAGGLQLFSRGKNLETEIGVLKSYSMSRLAVEDLDFGVSYFIDEPFRSDYEIYKNAPFIVQFDTAFSQLNNIPVYITFKSKDTYNIQIEAFEIDEKLKIGQQFKYKDFSFNIILKDTLNFNPEIIGKHYFFVKNDINQVVLSYQTRFDVSVSPERSSILWLWMIGTVPQKDADFINKLVEVYIKKDLREKNEKAVSIIDFIDKQLGGVSDSLSQTEDKMQMFKQSTQTLNISEEATLLISKLDGLEELLKTNTIKLNYYTYIYEDLKVNINTTSLTPPSVMDINDQILISYMTVLSETVTERQVLDFNVKSGIPTSDVMDLKINKIQNQIINHAKKNIEVTSAAIKDLKKRIETVKSDIHQLPLSERRMINIERQFNLNDQIYTFLLQRRMEAAITQASNKADTKALDPAMAENAIRKSPDTAGNTQKALILGFLFPIIILVLLEFFNNKIESKKDIENGTNLPIVATIGFHTKKTQIPVFDSPKSPISESFRALRTNLQYLLREKNQKIVAVTSSISGEGKSFIAINLAAVLALSGKKTLLVGLDLRKPRLQEEFGTSPTMGISTFLIGKNSASEIIQSTRVENLFVALSGPVPPNPSELIESDTMKNFFRYAHENFDYIIVDTPPVAIVTDALLLTEFADSFLYVIRQNYSNKSVIKLVDELNKMSNIKQLNLVLNDVKIAKSYGNHYEQGYGYGYGYGYGQGYYDDDKPEKASFYKKIREKFRK